MLAYRHSGFSVDTSVCIAAHDRTDLERLLRYCARPPFALAGLREAGSKLVYRCAKQHSEPTSDKRGDKWGTKADELHLTPLELIDRIAALVPPPRTHRHRYFWCARTQFAAQGCSDGDGLRPDATGNCTAPVIRPASCHWRKRRRDKGPAPMGHAIALAPEPVPPKRAAHYLWAVLIARIYVVFPLLCPLFGGQMRIIAFITHSADIRHILEHIGVACEPPQNFPARGPPLWESCDALAGEGSQIVSDWDLAAQPTPDYEVDQRVSW